MNKLVLCILTILTLNSCVNLREPYPKIDYYSISQETSLLTNLPVKDAKLMVRRVLVNESFDTPHILIKTELSGVQKFFYHRWISDVSTMTTDFVITRLNQCGLFKNGVLRNSSLAIPDYFVEIQIIDMTAYNFEPPRTQENYVSIELKADILKRMPDNSLKILSGKSYKQTYTRRIEGTKYIPEAYSKVFSLAVDNLVSDLSNNIE
jgi:ABC-type uncharacterized transport system auxiliary subunit